MAWHRKMTSDQVSVCIQREVREWKYQKMSIVCRYLTQEFLTQEFSGIEQKIKTKQTHTQKKAINPNIRMKIF